MAEKIVATVAGKEITETEFNTFLQRVPAEQQQFLSTPEGRQQVLGQYCDYYLFEKLGQEKGYDKDPEYTDMIEGVVRELLSQYTLTKMLKDLIATDEECKKFYDENPESFVVGAQANAKHILTDTEEASKEALAKIESGEKTFEEMAKEVSTCPSAAQGGDLGTFGRGQMVQEFDQAVFEGAEIGKVIGPVKTQFGYHLIRVDSLTEGGTAPFEEAVDQIRQHLTSERQAKVYNDARVELIEKYGLNFAE